MWRVSVDLQRYYSVAVWWKTAGQMDYWTGRKLAADVSAAVQTLVLLAGLAQKAKVRMTDQKLEPVLH